MRWIDSDFWNNIDVPWNELLDEQVISHTGVTFTNVFHDRAITPLNKIINEEFKIPVKFDEHIGNQSFLISEQDDSLIAYLSDAEHREFTLSIEYRLRQPNYGTSVNTLNQASLVMERLRRLIFTNRNLENGSTWFNARIEAIEYRKEEDENNYIFSNADFTCSTIILGS